MSKLLSFFLIIFFGEKCVEKKSPSSNYFYFLSNKIADFGQSFTTCFSSFIPEIQEIFLRKTVIGKTSKFEVFPIFARKLCVCLSGRFPAWLSKLLSTCPEEMIWEKTFLNGSCVVIFLVLPAKTFRTSAKLQQVFQNCIIGFQ